MSRRCCWCCSRCSSRRTLLGKALRACSSNRIGARLVGIPTSAAGQIAFALAALLGAVSGVLVGPLMTVFYDSGFLIGLKAFVAAILGGLASYPLTVVAALGVGFAEALFSFWASNFKEVLVFTLIILGSGMALGLRAACRGDGMKPSRGPLIAVCCAAAILILPFTGLMPDYWITLFNYIGISSLVATGLVLVTGVGGMTSFGQAAFVGFGAYTTGVLTVHLGISPWLTLPASLVVTMVERGGPDRRGHGAAFRSLSAAWHHRLGHHSLYLFGNVGWLGAHDGLDGIPPLRIAGHALTDPREYFVVVWIAVVLTVIATQNLLGGRIGRAIRALRRSTRAAEAFGVNTSAAKLMVFVYAAMLAGLAGWLYAHFQRSVSPSPFGINAGTEYLLMAVLGGAGRVYGAILGAAGITVLRDQLQNLLPWLIGQHRQFRDGGVRCGSGARSCRPPPAEYGRSCLALPRRRHRQCRSALGGCRIVNCRLRGHLCCKRRLPARHSAGWSPSTT